MGQYYAINGSFLLEPALGVQRYAAEILKQMNKMAPAYKECLRLVLVLCYAFGTFWFLTVYTGGSGETLLGALTLCVFPYVLPDLGKIFLALVLVSRVKKHLAL